MKSGISLLAIATVLAALPSAAFAQTAALEEIVVTSTKRVETIREIPLSVSVVTGETLENYGLQDPGDLSQTIPGLTVTSNGSGKNITLRGIGSPSGQRGTEQSVSMYVDGVYKPRSRQYVTAFLDTERVEVLRGPQAVLFGINATAGAISVVSNTNSGGDAFEAGVTAEADLEYGGYKLSGYAGGGVSENLGLRIAASHSDFDGYLSGPLGKDGGRSSTQIRGSLEYQATDAFKLTAKADYFEDEYNGPVFEGVDITQESPDLNYLYPASTPSVDLFGAPEGRSSDGLNLVVTADFGIGDHTLRAIASHSEFNFELGFDFDGGSEADGFLLGAAGAEALSFDSINNEEFDQQSLELQLISPQGQSFEYIVGANYLTSDTVAGSGVAINSPFFLNAFYNPAAGALRSFHTQDPTNPYNNPIGIGFNSIDQETVSVYATGTFHVRDDLRLTAGARYLKDEKDSERYVECGLVSDGFSGIVRDDTPGRTGACAAANNQDIAAGGPGAFFIGQGGGGNLSQKFDSLSPEAAVHWDMNDNHTLFARVAQNEKSGGLSSSYATAIGASAFDAENVTAFEIGTKSRVLDGRAEFNITAFNNDYEDLQVTSFVFGSARVDNAGKATVRGIEADGRMALHDYITIGGSATWLDAEYDEYIDGSCPSGGLNSASTVNLSGTCNLSGQPLINAPDISYNAYVDMVIPVTNGINFTGGLNLNHSGSYFTEAVYYTDLKQDSYQIMNGYLGIEGEDRGWSLKLVGNNITDELLTGPGVVINALGLGAAVPVGNAPRRINLVGSVKF